MFKLTDNNLFSELKDEKLKFIIDLGNYLDTANFSKYLFITNNCTDKELDEIARNIGKFMILSNHYDENSDTYLALFYFSSIDAYICSLICNFKKHSSSAYVDIQFLEISKSYFQSIKLKLN